MSWSFKTGHGIQALYSRVMPPMNFYIPAIFRCLSSGAAHDGHVKEPCEMSMAWEPDRRCNFFFSPSAHLCAVTYMTEISLIVTLNNQFNPIQTWLLLLCTAGYIQSWPKKDNSQLVIDQNICSSLWTKKDNSHQCICITLSCTGLLSKLAVYALSGCNPL